jgi:hypothetical protein
LCAAARLPGKSLHVAILLWFRAGITRNRSVRLGRSLAVQFYIGRKSVALALSRLEAAGLVSTEGGRGRCPVVTILDLPGATSGDQEPAPGQRE